MKAKFLVLFVQLLFLEVGKYYYELYTYHITEITIVAFIGWMMIGICIGIDSMLC